MRQCFFPRVLPPIPELPGYAEAVARTEDRARAAVEASRDGRDLPAAPASPNEGLTEEQVDHKKRLDLRKMRGNTPDDVFGKKVVRLMQHVETSLKRVAAELVFTLCEEDAAEFTQRAGFGNAVHLLPVPVVE